MERILVTGGAGYVGSVLVARLLGRGHAVTVLDNLRYRQESLLHCATEPGFSFEYGDARDEGVMGRLLARHDAIIPLAALVGQKACDLDPRAAEETNLGAIRLLNRLRSRDQRVIWPCTISGYGTRNGDLVCTEDTPLEPISLYGRTKVDAERELLSGGPAVSLRLATVFGPSPRPRLDLLVNDFVHRALTDGFLVIYEKDFRRQYLHIEDAAGAFVHGLEHFDEMKGEAYNVGLAGANLSKAELAEKIREHVPSLYVHFAEVGSDPDRRNYVVSSDKIARRGFVARRSLDEGIRQLVAAHRMMPRSAALNA